MIHTFLKIALLSLAWGISFMMPSFAQDIEEDVEVSEKDRVFVLGVNLTNRGWGFNTYYGTGGKDQQIIFGIDLHSVKSSRETPIESAFGDQGKNYIYGKQNYLYVFTPSVGFQRDLIKNRTGNLLDVHVGVQVGPAFGIINPYSVEIFEPVSNNNPGQNYYGYRIIEPYNPEKHSYDEIIGRANILSSKLDLSAKVGLSARTHVLVDFTRSLKYIGGIQFTLNADYFPQEIPIMAEFDGELNNHRFFLAGSIGLVFGNRWQ